MATIHSNVPLNGDQNIDEDEALLRERLKTELMHAGMTSWGMKKFNTKYLHKIIHPNEHVEGVIYGRFSEAPGWLNWVDRMVVATDRRVISLNHKPGYTDIDEFTYDVIDGVEISRAGAFSSVRLHAKTGNVSVRFVNRLCADKFVHYIEQRRLEFFQPINN